MIWCMKYLVYLGVSFLRFFTISLIVFYQKSEYFILTEFQNDVDELGVLEDAIKLDNIALMKCFMDLDF